jgi:hypothetical protein
MCRSTPRQPKVRTLRLLREKIPIWLHTQWLSGQTLSALLLVAVGVYRIVAHVVRQRKRDFDLGSARHVMHLRRLDYDARLLTP